MKEDPKNQIKGKEKLNEKKDKNRPSRLNSLDKQFTKFNKIEKYSK